MSSRELVRSRRAACRWSESYLEAFESEERWTSNDVQDERSKRPCSASLSSGSSHRVRTIDITDCNLFKDLTKTTPTRRSFRLLTLLVLLLLLLLRGHLRQSVAAKRRWDTFARQVASGESDTASAGRS